MLERKQDWFSLELTEPTSWRMMPNKCLHAYALKAVEYKSLELRRKFRTSASTVGTVRRVRTFWRPRIEFLKRENIRKCLENI